MAENTGMILVAIVAVVAVVAMLNNFNSTGRVVLGSNDVVQTAERDQLYLTQWQCEDNDQFECDSFEVETRFRSASTFHFWICAEDKDKLCHRFYYRI